MWRSLSTLLLFLQLEVSESGVEALPFSPMASLSLCLNLSSFELALDTLRVGDMEGECGVSSKR